MKLIVLIFFMAFKLFAASFDNEIVANLDFFTNYEYLEQDDFYETESNDIERIDSKELDDISNIGLSIEEEEKEKI